ncbi:hypothetical protein BC834DRAFT_852381 [Gloeopeniophorella convolvens]|nr:hypothetical protein BC834DRAFT_852381 [Gloeopeniophorella convolvens]
MDNEMPPERTPVDEFYWCIRYLNKIKARYPDDQNTTYKRFFEILQTCLEERQSSQEDLAAYRHREQQMVHNVYTQMQALFINEEDLFTEFKSFLLEFSGATQQPR